VVSENCPPVDPHRDKDLAEIIGPPGIEFGPEDHVGPSSHEVEDPEIEAQMWRDAGKLYVHRDTAENRPFAQLGRFLRIPSSMFKDVQYQTGAPLWTWLRSIELGREASEKFLAEPSYSIVPRIFKGLSIAEDEQVQTLFELDPTSQMYKTLADGPGPKVVAAKDQLYQLYLDYFASVKMGSEDVSALLTEVMPQMRKRNGDFVGWKKSSQIPKVAHTLEKPLATGEIVARETRASVIAKQIFRSVATEKYMAPHWNMVMTQFKGYVESGELPAPLTDIFLRYMHEARHSPDVLQVGLAKTFQAVLKRVDQSPRFNKLLGVSKLSDIDAGDLAGALTGMNAQANLAWNPGVILRQYMQTLQTTAPMIGINDSMKGVKTAMRWFKSEELQKYYEARGIVTRDVMHERFREVERIAQQFQPEGTAASMKRLLDYIRTKGTSAFKKGDDFNRIVAYDGMIHHAKQWAEKYAKGEIDWATYEIKSKLDMLRVDPNGDIALIVRTHLDAGNVEEALHEQAREFTQHTQFNYRRGNNPYFMQSTAGRFFGQYGTWPTWFAEYMRTTLVRGSYENRIKTLARWTALNGAMMYGASSVFGVDLARWTFFSPMTYSGGPFLEMAQQTSSAVSLAAQGQIDPKKSLASGKIIGTPDADPVDLMQAARLSRSLVTQTVPLPWAAGRHVVSAYERAWNLDYAEAGRQLLGFPSSDAKK